MAADEDDKTSAGGGNAGAGDAKPAGERRQRERRQRPPVTIDLKAEDVRAKPATQEPQAKPETAAKLETPGAAETPRPSEPPRPSAGARAPRVARAFSNMDDASRRSVVAGVAGGVIALILVIVLQAIGILPAPGRSAANQAAEQARAAADATLALERRLTAIEAMAEGLPAMRADSRALGERIAALDATQGTLATKGDVEAVVGALGALRQRLEALPQSASRSDVDTLAERIGRLEVRAAAGGDASGSEAAITSLASQLGNAETGLRSLTERLAAAEEKMASLGTANPMAGGEAAVRAIAITALRRAAEGSEPFTIEADMVAALGVAGGDVAGLRPMAARGVPAKAALIAEFPAVAGAILAATATSDPNAGFFQRMLSGLGGLVSIRPAGPVAGSDPPAIASRMIAAVAKGDLAAALAEREGLPRRPCRPRA
ncbi:MAG: hypothetical protein NUV72_07550, partial [Bauldia sp.]|nr:hypothetical protein [Bauldia sp.]